MSMKLSIQWAIWQLCKYLLTEANRKMSNMECIGEQPYRNHRNPPPRAVLPSLACHLDNWQFGVL